MKVFFIAPFALLLLSCATSQQTTPDGSAWTSFAYEGFGAKVERLAGTDAIDCGVINRVNKNDPVNKGNSVRKARACVEESVANGVPFKYGTVRIPLDSYLFEALVYTPSKEYWIVHYDVMLDGIDNMHVIKRCKQIDLARSDSIFEGVDCVDVSTVEWLSDIPEQQY